MQNVGFAMMTPMQAALTNHHHHWPCRIISCPRNMLLICLLCFVQASPVHFSRQFTSKSGSDSQPVGFHGTHKRQRTGRTLTSSASSEKNTTLPYIQRDKIQSRWNGCSSSVLRIIDSRVDGQEWACWKARDMAPRCFLLVVSRTFVRCITHSSLFVRSS